MLDRIEAILGELDTAENVSDVAKLQVLRSLVSPIRLLGHFTGEVGASETTVAASPFYRRVRASIVEALRPKEFAAAADAVIAAMDRLEGAQPERTTEAAAE